MNDYTLKSIADKVSTYLDVDVRSKRRKRDCVYARVIYYKLCREYTHHSLERIGNEVSKDHASVYVGLKQFDSMSFYKDNYWKAYITIKQQFDFNLMGDEHLNYPDGFWRERYFNLKRKIDKLTYEEKVATTDR